MSVWWSIGLTAAGITGWWLAGSGPRWAPWGWGVAVAVQPFWIAFAIVGRQWGFIAAGLFYAAVALRNMHRARRPQHGFNSPVWDDTEDDPRARGWQAGTYTEEVVFPASGRRKPLVLGDDGWIYDATSVILQGRTLAGIQPGERVAFHVPGREPMSPAWANAVSSLHNRSPEMDIKLGVPTRYAGYRLGDRRAESTPPPPDLPSGVRVQLDMDEGLRTMPPALTRPLEGP
jgi:hypothetical protein